MDKEKRKKLEAKGWKVTSVAEFLELSPDEASLIELRLALSSAVKNHRLEAKLTQQEAARMLHSSQSRIAKSDAAKQLIKKFFPLRLRVFAPPALKSSSKNHSKYV